MSNETYVDLRFDEEKIRITFLTNICRMLLKRGYMDIKKYMKKDNTEQTKQNEQFSRHDIIDNELFLPFIEKRVDNNVYTIPLDIQYPDKRVSDEKNNFDGSKVIVKIIPQSVKEVTKSPMLNEFFKTYSNYHKIIVFDDYVDKVYSILHKKKNVEIFKRDDLMIDLMSHECAPISCEFVTLDDISYIINPKIAKILENDPLTRYYDGTRGQIMRIIRPSLNHSVETIYRKVIEPKFIFKK
jgi:hypothetical protein